MTRQRHILYLTLALAVLVYSLNALAYTHYFYWTYWWYDVMMHFLAGVTIGFLVYWLLFSSGKFFKVPRSKTFMITMVFATIFLIGLAWEVFEYTNGLTDSHEGYLQDTTNDLILDSCGGILAALIALRKKRYG